MNDTWFTVTAIDNSTFAISEYGHWEQVHSFLLLGADKAALIDTGLGIGNIRSITDQLTTLPIDVLTTHVHTEQIRRDISKDITRPTPETFAPSTYKPYQGQPSGLLHDGDQVDLGGGRIITVYHTPGHSPGHLCFWDSQRGFLFSGDLLYDTMPVYAFYPSTSPADLTRSLIRIAEINGVRKVYGSHHTLGLDPEILLEAKRAARYLQEQGFDHFGTGIHRFNGFSVQF